MVTIDKGFKIYAFLAKALEPQVKKDISLTTVQGIYMRDLGINENLLRELNSAGAFAGTEVEKWYNLVGFSHAAKKSYRNF